jgi:hypothetical protein
VVKWKDELDKSGRAAQYAMSLGEKHRLFSLNHPIWILRVKPAELKPGKYR